MPGRSRDINHPMNGSILRPLLVATLAALAGPALAQTVTVDPANRTVSGDMRALPVHVGGRVESTPLPAPLPAAPPPSGTNGPGSTFEAAFRGDRVVLKFDDPANEYRLLVDDLPPVSLAQPGAAEITVGGLADRPHSLRLEKVTESIGLPETFAGFASPATARPIALRPPRPRQIDFIGDLALWPATALRSASRQCTREQVRLLTDTQAAYPALVARQFDADHQVNAISGRGLVRNYNGESPDAPLARALLPARCRRVRTPGAIPRGSRR